MRQFIATVLARAVDAGLTLLRNKHSLHLTRDEFRYSRISFSQFGEDIAVSRTLNELFPNATRIYVDAGSYHPIHFSNTLLLRKQGWWGVNIDMVPEKIARFNQLRPGDYNVVAALHSRSIEMFSVQYDGGLIDQLSFERPPQGSRPREPARSSAVITETLDTILARSPRKINKIGYLNIDCEGNDFDVLVGLSLTKYAPDVITIEALNDERARQIGTYLGEKGYSLKDRLHFTLLFLRDEKNTI